MMVLGIIGLLVGLAGLILAVVAFVKLSDLEQDVRSYKSGLSEELDTLKRKVGQMARQLPEPEEEDHVPSALTPDTEKFPHLAEAAGKPKKNGSLHIRKAAPRTQERKPPPPPPPAPVLPVSPLMPASPLPPPPAAASPSLSGPGGSSWERVAKSVETEPGFVNFDCPHCAQNIEAPDAMVGVVLQCPSCNETISVPRKSTASSAAMLDSLIPALGEVAPAANGEVLVEEEMKGTTVRIDLGGMLEEIKRPKRQIVIKRKQ
jgi:hypothetical protein